MLIFSKDTGTNARLSMLTYITHWYIWKKQILSRLAKRKPLQSRNLGASIKRGVPVRFRHRLPTKTSAMENLIWSRSQSRFLSLPHVGYSDFIHYSYSGGSYSPYTFVQLSYRIMSKLFGWPTDATMHTEFAPEQLRFFAATALWQASTN